ncbi:Aste57867_13409 [Aphanomyces stellatus]|uniref:Aste57867_13409 protein n=1 Tax=Aphanomyces stellatus TaxID=120398 RepID=A0A485KY26_9STRA|nr:hypothetical protein As57867_013359 [Aphanomyces stellatus]VFT90248.1 Aste57867_13409 [Aphanomyces stellatus]
MDDIDLDFTEAIASGDVATVMQFVDGAKVDVNTPDRDGDVPLHVASKKNQLVVAEYLLQMGAGIDVVDENGWTALHEATLNGSEEMVRVLLKWGADKTIRNQDGRHALDLAVQYGHGPIVFLLCDGHDPDLGFF